MFSSSGRVSHARATRWLLRSSSLLVALATLLSVAACATVTVGTTHKIVADVSVKFFDESAPAAPTALDKQYTVTCPQGQYVLAGGYNLAVSDASSDWLASDLISPVEAEQIGFLVDANGFYRPIPQLMRVVASQPTPTLDGWTIQLAGMSYPDADRKVAVYAYCAGGLRVRPTVVRRVAEPGCKGIDGGDDLISGGGYSTGKYDYYVLVDTPTQAEVPEKQSAYMPVYQSYLNSFGYPSVWEVLADSGGFAPAGYGTVSALAICVSRQDFSSEDQVKVATMTFNPTSWVATDVHGKAVYSSEQDGATPCHAGELMLAGEDEMTSLDHLDLRVDGLWEDLTLDHWAAKLSVGRAASYTGESRASVDIHVLCLTPA